MNVTLIIIGIACILAAVVGGGLEMAGIKIPVLDSRVRQLLVGLVGVLVLIFSFVQPRQPAETPSEAGSPNTTLSPTEATRPQSPSTPASSASTPSPANLTHYLDEDQFPSQTKGCSNLEKGSYYFAGHSYDRSIATKARSCTGGVLNYFQYDLDPSQQCSHFDVTLGVSRDEVDYARAYMEVLIDGRSAGSSTLPPNKAYVVSAPVKPDSIIRLVAINRNTQYASGHPEVLSVFGDARLTCQS